MTILLWQLLEKIEFETCQVYVNLANFQNRDKQLAGDNSTSTDKSKTVEMFLCKTSFGEYSTERCPFKIRFKKQDFERRTFNLLSHL